VLGISGILGGLLRPRAETSDGASHSSPGCCLRRPVWALFAAPPCAAHRRRTGAVGRGRPAGRLGHAAGIRLHQRPRRAAGWRALSPRSLVATLAFMAAGFATVFLLRHVFA
jgi:hypothetical protein